MSKTAPLVLVLVFLTASCIFVVKPVSGKVQENSWVEKAPMPTARGYLETAVVNGKIYAIGGSGPIGTNEEYNPATDKWTTRSPMPTPEQSFAIAVFQDKIYCIGGLPYGNTGLNQVYDPATDSWENKAPLPTARYGMQANVVDGKIYLMGGVKWKEGYSQGFELLNITEVYDPLSDTWTVKSPMPNSEGYVSAVVDNKIYVIGAELTQIYNPGTDNWTVGAPPLEIITLGANGQSASAAATTGLMAPKRIYVYDGSSLQVYDTQNNNWTFGAAPPVSRQYLGIANFNDMLYFIGGFSIPFFGMYKDYSTNEQYTPIGYGTIPEATIFPTAKPESFSILPVAAVFVIMAAVVVTASLMVYFKNRKRPQEATQT